MPTLDVRLLGPLEVRIDGASVAVPRGNTATVLAILLDDANNVVPLESIVRAVYGLDVPQDPETQVQNTIGVLRRKLGALRDRVETVGRAYRFRIDTAELDTLRCKADDDESRRLKAEGRLGEAAAALRRALAEWRGPALADQAGPTVEAVRRRYDEHRLTLLERRIALDLELGRHAEVVEELGQIVAVHDTRQRFTALLMRALHAAGRTADALAAFEALKTRLAEKLGADPNREITDVHTGILRDESPPPPEAPAAPAPRRVPAMLPRANSRFTGREREIRLLDGFLETSEGEAGLAVITGMGGVGKTALAVRWAHRVAHRFPDGQLYVNLRGFDPLAAGTDAAAVIGEVLAALGVEPHRVPAGLNERIGLYRTVLAQRRILVVLDNARDAAQVRPLLPVAPGSFTLVTSRDRLAGLDATEGADSIALELLSEADAWALLVRRIGMQRALEEEKPVKRIVASCGRLPLALTLIGAWAAAHPGFSLAALAARLESTTNVFRVLTSSDLASDPRSVFACSYQELGTRAAQAFRMFGLHPGTDLTVPAMASLMGASTEDAEAALVELTGVHLVDQLREGRYSMHDLLRAYAKERLNAEVAAELREAADQRLVAYFLHSTHLADELLTLHGGGVDLGEPAAGVALEPIGDAKEAAAWFATEYEVLIGLMKRESTPGEGTRTWQLAWCLAEFMISHGLGRELREAQAAALEAAERAGDVFGRIVSHGYLAAAMTLLGDVDEAGAQLRRAIALSEEYREPWASGFVYFGLCVEAARLDREQDALDAARMAHRHFTEAGDWFWEHRSLWAIGWHAARVGLADEARACFERIARAAEAAGFPSGTGHAHMGFGLIAHLEKDFDGALAHYERARSVFSGAEHEPSAAYVRELVGDVLWTRGDGAAACAEWREAERVYIELGALRELDRVRTKLSAR
ncbi:BTAD domain-containing putative transcriptional regulator [Glycomyces sp. NPDC046736]|uniref:AfsR/SARP family transcriptional regulator n=1 Tax=Glycomyces sp. NPDC046736 TaxID=3155615 RepID=UPI0033DB3D2D